MLFRVFKKYISISELPKVKWIGHFKIKNGMSGKFINQILKNRKDILLNTIYQEID